MRALAFKQPWAGAILALGKTLDNRSYRDGSMPPAMKHRGPLAIHASAQVDRAYWHDAVEWMRGIGVEVPVPWAGDTSPADPSWGRGGIIGVADVVGHMTPDGQLWADPQGRQPLCNMVCAERDEWRRWHMSGSYGLLLRHVRPVPFTPWKGHQQLFDVPDLVMAEAMA